MSDLKHSNPIRLWYATTGLADCFGGVSQVSRSSTAAFAESAGFELQRVISLLDQPDYADCPAERFIGCNGNRKRFALEISKQVVHRPDMIVYDHIDIAQCQTVLPRYLRRPHRIWIHGVEVWKELPKRKLAGIGLAEHLLFNSNYTRRRFSEFHPAQYPSTVVHLTADMVQHQAAPKTAREPWILTVGRVEPWRPKGHIETLAVMPEILKRVPEAQWHIVGAGKQLSEFRKAVDQSPARDRITIHGFLDYDELVELYQTARVFCMPSHGEGFGIVYLEALTNGCIPIGSTKDAASEVIGDAGDCVELECPGQLVESICTLLLEGEESFQERSSRAIDHSLGFDHSNFKKGLLNTFSLEK